jgi:hypothetical protein
VGRRIGAPNPIRRTPYLFRFGTVVTMAINGAAPPPKAFVLDLIGKWERGWYLASRSSA